MTESRGSDYPAGTEDPGSWDELINAPGEAVDLDQDGTADAVVLDLDQDSVPDTALLDTDGDAVADLAVVDLEAAAGPAVAEQPLGEAVPAAPGYPDPFEDVGQPPADPSDELPESLETASDDVFDTAMRAEQSELDNLDTPLS